MVTLPRYAKLYSQNGECSLSIDSVTSIHPMYTSDTSKGAWREILCYHKGQKMKENNIFKINVMTAYSYRLLEKIAKNFILFNSSIIYQLW